jgi:hypothetical protein
VTTENFNELVNHLRQSLDVATILYNKIDEVANKVVIIDQRMLELGDRVGDIRTEVALLKRGQENETEEKKDRQNGRWFLSSAWIGAVAAVVAVLVQVFFQIHLPLH